MIVFYKLSEYLFTLSFLAALVLCIIAETELSLYFGLTVFSLSGAVLILSNRSSEKPLSALSKWICILLPCASLLLLIVLPKLPDGINSKTSTVNAHFTRAAHYPRFSPFNFISEIDQVKTGLFLVPLIDPFIDLEQGKRFYRITMKLYRELIQSKELTNLGTALQYCYFEMLGLSFDQGHLSYIVPDHTPGEKLPLLLLVHGSAGPFQTYTWLLKQFAERYRFIVVMPTFGCGNWLKKGGLEAIERARTFALSELPVDSNRIYLAGLSNGGLGLALSAAKSPAIYSGLIFLSAVPFEALLLSENFSSRWHNKEMLFIHGALDRRIPIEAIKNVANKLEGTGIHVETEYFQNEDHFLFFSSPQKVFSVIAHWLSNKKQRTLD